MLQDHGFTECGIPSCIGRKFENEMEKKIALSRKHFIIIVTKERFLY